MAVDAVKVAQVLYEGTPDSGTVTLGKSMNGFKYALVIARYSGTSSYRDVDRVGMALVSKIPTSGTLDMHMSTIADGAHDWADSTWIRTNSSRTQVELQDRWYVHYVIGINL